MKDSLVMELQRERMRQIIDEGYTPDHDDEHINGDLCRAAAAYALCGKATRERISPMTLMAIWPWKTDDFRPSSKRRNLIKAGALILAEIERLDRCEP